MTAIIATAPPGGRLHFEQTVDRTLLHRRALSEVFLTDTAGIGEGSYLAGAQLPSSHAYYTDHTGHTVLDPILLLECARQAETYGAHVHLGVSQGTRFVLRTWSMRLPGLFATQVGAADELTMTVTTNRQAGIRVPPRSLTYDIALSLAGTPIGDVRMDVGYLSAPAYLRLRTLRRAGGPVTSDQVTATVATVLPAAVGRTAPVNVMLVNPVRSGNGFSATVRLPVDNRSMFDHPLDHLPGMVLTEAGRQLCLLTGAEVLGLPATAATVVGVDLRFSQFAELDAPTAVLTTAERSGGPGTHVFALSFHQRGEVIAHGTMTTRVIPATHRVAR